METDLQNLHSGRLRKGRILVVDDEAPVGQLLQQWLIDEGYYALQVLTFDAVQRAMQQTAFDLVTLDIMMPDVDGLQVLRWIKAHYPEVGVVMATALSNLDTVLEALRAGASNYLLKPFNLELVSEEIARAMEQQRLLAENRSYQVELEQKVAVQTHALQHAYARQQQHIKELEGRDQLVHCQMSGPTLPQAYEEILQVVEQVLAIQQAVMYRPKAADNRLEAVASLEDGKNTAAVPAVSVDEEGALVAQVFRDLQPRYGAGHQAAVPLLYQEEVLGVLWVNGLPEEDKEEAGNTLWRLGQEAALVLWSAQVAEELASGQVQVDELLKLE